MLVNNDLFTNWFIHLIVIELLLDASSGLGFRTMLPLPRQERCLCDGSPTLPLWLCLFPWIENYIIPEDMASWSWGLPLENSLNAGRKFHAKSFQPIPKGCPSRCMASPMVHLQVQAVDICKFCRQSLKEWLGVSPHVHMGHSQWGGSRGKGR